jgi:hypothetical protein
MSSSSSLAGSANAPATQSAPPAETHSLPPAALPPPRPTFAQLCAPGLAALRTYWRPFLLIQILALAIVILYYTLTPFRDACQTLAALKDRFGLLWVAVTAALAGGLLPELAKLATRTNPRPWRQRLYDVTFDLFYFAFAGTSVNLFYLLQSHLFGDDPTPLTVIKKVAADEFGFTVLWASPWGIFAYTLKSHHLNLRATLRDLTLPRLLQRLPELLIPCWAFWIPMVAMIYALPAPSLQYLLFSIALAAWALLLTFIATPQKQ